MVSSWMIIVSVPFRLGNRLQPTGPPTQSF
jgi:hypothetical protein